MFKKALFIIVIIVIVVAGAILFLNNKDEREVVSFEQTEESALPKTEIRVTGLDSELLITPSVDNVISGIVTISMTKAPAETKSALFLIVEKGEDFKTVGPNLGIDTDGSDGWSRIVDTTQYENGLYDIATAALDVASPGSGDDPIAMTAAQVIIQN